MLDILYVGYLFWTLYLEVKDLTQHCRLGCHSILQYVRLYWNIVDWCTILLGLANIVAWNICCTDMSSGLFQDLLDQTSSHGSLRMLQTNAIDLDTDFLVGIHRDIDKLCSSYLLLSICVSCTVFTLVLKFFKAFAANLRLNVVTNTLVNSAADIFHFFIVFLTIFLCFAAIAHVLFGQDIEEFSSLSLCVKTSFATLMGDFGWYTDQPLDADFFGAHFLPSGTPRIFLAIWFSLYMVFVLLLECPKRAFRLRLGRRCL